MQSSIHNLRGSRGAATRRFSPCALIGAICLIALWLLLLLYFYFVNDSQQRPAQNAAESTLGAQNLRDPPFEKENGNGSEPEAFCEPQDPLYTTNWGLNGSPDLSDWEVASISISKSIVYNEEREGRGRVAFMFLVRAPIPMERLWARFFEGHESKYSIYIHPAHSKYTYPRSHMATSVFVGRNIPSQDFQWGQMTTVDAERRLLAWALLDLTNRFFVLLSEACIPIRSFPFVYTHLLEAKHSFVECYQSGGEAGVGRWTEGLGPEVDKASFRKGSQWFALNRRHAVAIVADTLFYIKFLHNCKQGKENHNCFPEEHYIQTFFHMMDPGGISNFSLTFVDWSTREWHPKVFHSPAIDSETNHRIQVVNKVERWMEGEGERETPCMRNGLQGPCHLFARLFDIDSLEALLRVPQEVLGY